MSNSFPHLFSPQTIRNKACRNRILFGPTLFAHSVYIDEIRENIYRMCVNRAKGGAMEVSTKEICINAENRSVTKGKPLCSGQEPAELSLKKQYYKIRRFF